MRTPALLGALVLGAGAHAQVLGHDTVTAAGTLRDYYYHVSDSAASRAPAPLVLFFHGGGGNARGAAHRYAFDAAAAKAGAIIVYPEGLGHHWSDGRDPARVEDEVAFARALIVRAEQRWSIDRRRIYAVGHSNGAMMSYSLACRMPGVLAAIGTVGGAQPENDLATCVKAKPVSVIAIHGTDDPLIPYDGGGGRGVTLAAVRSATLWARIDGCDTTYARTELPLRVPSDSTHAIRVEFQNCPAARAVVLYVLDGGGHGWPGENDPLPERIVGPRSEAVLASPLIWEFLSAHPMRDPH